MNNALSKLADGELCYLIIGALTYQASWSIEHGCWFCDDLHGPRSILPTEVDEWIPAGVRP